MGARHRGITDGFAQTPNSWSRDPELNWRAKGLLTYIAGHAENYHLRVEQMVAETRDGVDATQAALRELIAAGYVERHRERVDGKLGNVVYRIASTGPGRRGDDQGKRQKPRRATPGKARHGDDQGELNESAAQPIDGEARHGVDQQEQDVSAGETTTGFVMHDETTHGKSGCIRRLRKEDQGLEDQENTTTTAPPTPPSPAPPPTAANGGGEPQPKPQDQRTQTIDAILAIRPGWTRKGIERQYDQAIADGRDPTRIATVFATVAKNTTIHTPGLLNTAQPEAWAVSEAKPDGPKCPAHGGDLANCGGCAGEAKAAGTTKPPPTRDGGERDGTGYEAFKAGRAALGARRRGGTPTPRSGGCGYSTCRGGQIQVGRNTRPCPNCAPPPTYSVDQYQGPTFEQSEQPEQSEQSEQPERSGSEPPTSTPRPQATPDARPQPTEEDGHWLDVVQAALPTPRHTPGRHANNHPATPITAGALR